MDEIKQVIETIARGLVDLPDEVQVDMIRGEQTTVIELKVAKSDVGKIIGKQGNTARSIRTILTATATKLKMRAVLEIID